MAALIALAAACGGTTASELFVGGSTDAGSSDASSLDAEVATDAPASDASKRADAHPHDAAPPVVDSAPPPPTQPRLECTPSDGHSCDLGTQICCKSGDAYTCQGPNDCADLSIPCASAADCDLLGQNGDVCCAEFDSNRNAIKAGCARPDQCLVADSRLVICSRTAPDPCPNGGKCNASTTVLPGFDLCY